MLLVTSILNLTLISLYFFITKNKKLKWGWRGAVAVEGGYEGLRVRLSKSNRRCEADGVQNRKKRVRARGQGWGFWERGLERRDLREWEMRFNSRGHEGLVSLACVWAISESLIYFFKSTSLRAGQPAVPGPVWHPY